MKCPLNLEGNECYYLPYHLMIIRLELGDADFPRGSSVNSALAYNYQDPMMTTEVDIILYTCIAIKDSPFSICRVIIYSWMLIIISLFQGKLIYCY